MNELRAGLDRAAAEILRYREALPTSHVAPTAGRDVIRRSLSDLRDEPAALDDVLDELLAVAAPGLMASAGPRYYGFVTGGTLDAALVAELLAVGWDQCAFNVAMSPAAIAFEDVAAAWLKELLGLPPTASVGFATGSQGANTVGIAAGRWHVLTEAGWDVDRDGLHDAPRVKVVAGAERHATIDRAVRLLGLGESAIVEVPARPDGAMDVSALPAVLEEGVPTIVCAQVGNVQTGACDDVMEVAEAAHRVGAWVHVDGAFGLWAAASPRTASLVRGVELADSWSCDGHKWLNVPYDCGYAICAHPDVHGAAVGYTASYLTGQVAGREWGGGDLVVESSRHARGFATWAALRSLGRSGVAQLVDRCCQLAGRFAEQLDALEGFEVVNQVVLNQVLIRTGDDELTLRLERAIQEDGTAWLGGTTWRGERLLRIAVSNWSTTAEDVDRVVATMGRLRAELTA